jgi:hypothetical protein
LEELEVGEVAVDTGVDEGEALLQAGEAFNVAMAMARREGVVVVVEDEAEAMYLQTLKLITLHKCYRILGAI